MFALRARSRRLAARPLGRRARLELEALETRDCPSALALQASILPDHVAQLSGTLVAPVAGGARVILGGAVSGTTVTDSTGRFSYSTTDAALGTVTAYAVDQAGTVSNTATATLALAAPTVTVAVSYGANRVVTISGRVNDLDPGGRVLRFSGVVTGSAVSNPDGTFRLQATSSGPGSFTVSTTDLWGQTSASAGGMLLTNPPVSGGGSTGSPPACAPGSNGGDGGQPLPPQIVDFTATEGSNCNWTFGGQVEDAAPAGLIVDLGGIPSLQGEETTTDDSGCFSLCVQLQAGESGTATAQTTDWWGQPSNVAQVFVDQT